ncbi:nodulin-26-like protein [Anopheles sinensis]|uniref:Nodulin-26-like protein n=1 Tax=Anopheles sinensis TaxID=74873 RepID=A0A084VNG3_ANOSI|nr:nodulin-26-like protein [Anopheles sinensis]
MCRSKTHKQKPLERSGCFLGARLTAELAVDGAGKERSEVGVKKGGTAPDRPYRSLSVDGNRK